MRGPIGAVGTLLLVLVPACAKDSQGLADEVADNIVDKAFERVREDSTLLVPSHRVDLDSTTLAKGSTMGASTKGGSVKRNTIGGSPTRQAGNAAQRAIPRPTPKSNPKSKGSAVAAKFGLTGKTIGKGKYVLCTNQKRSTSGRSTIYRAYRADGSGNPVGSELAVKIQPDVESAERENRNYNKITFGPFPGRFANKVEFLSEIHADPPSPVFSGCALIMEAGRDDLKAILAERGNQPLKGRALRDAAAAAAQCVQAVHSSGLVWTDLKSENFIVLGDETGDNGLSGLRAIDVESGVPNRAVPVSYSPEASPPEFARACFKGVGVDSSKFKLDYSYDIWSYGMFLYAIATGRPYFKRQTPQQIIRELYREDFKVDVSDVEDGLLRGLIEQCLSIDPKKRPGVAQILLHPYFLTTGVGPISFR